jgi:hypothetical protein
MTISRASLSLPGLALVAALLASSAAFAEGEELAQCAAKWIAAKENPKFYQPWGDYFNDCKKKLAEAPAAPKAEEAKPASMPETKAEPTKPAPAVAAPAPAPLAAPPPTAAPAPAPTPEAAKPAKPGKKPKKPAQHKPQG